MLDSELRRFRKCLLLLCGPTACTMQRAQVVCSEASEVIQRNIGSCYPQIRFIICFVLISFSVTRFSCVSHSAAWPQGLQPTVEASVKMISVWESRCPTTRRVITLLKSPLTLVSWGQCWSLSWSPTPQPKDQPQLVLSTVSLQSLNIHSCHGNFCIHRPSVARDTKLWTSIVFTSEWKNSLP